MLQRNLVKQFLESVQEIPLYILHNFRTFLSEKKASLISDFE